ncbi:MAG: haloacid dehalogenase-like hydrolase [Treponemataceae bacterium]|nr:MAG: haloacid dehalogenase-like hydrolase [Treponemataceae bacterium]
MNVYDFDGTIYGGDSTLDFYRFSFARKPALAGMLPFQAAVMAAYTLRRLSKEAMKAAFFRFLHEIPAADWVPAFWERHEYKLRRWYLQQKQFDDVIISASPEFLLTPLVCGVLGVQLIASRVDIHTGSFTGKNCHGAEKLRRFREAYGDDAVIDTFYSDSRCDAPIANIAKKAFLVKNNHIVEWGAK